MASLNTYNQDKLGFTLLEILVSLGILSLVLSIGVFVSINTYRSYLFRSEKDNIVSILTRARALSINNINQSQHGVCYLNEHYILFEGSSCNATDPKNIYFDASSAVASQSNFTTKFPTIVFAQLSGDTAGFPPITVTGGARSGDIRINSEGRIDW